MTTPSQPAARRSRWRRVVLGLGLGLVLLCGGLFITLWATSARFAAFGGEPSAETLARMKASGRYVNGHFFNLERKPYEMKIPFAVFWEYFTSKEMREPSCPLPLVRDSAPILQTPPTSGLRITWLGHSTTLIEVDGTRVLTDPIFSERASPSPLGGPKRFHPPPLKLEDLPRLDAAIVSHDHFDHLDRPTIEALAQQVQDGQRRTLPTRTGVPTRVRRVLERALAPDPAQRWPTLDAMLVALSRARHRSTGALLGLGGVLLAGLGLGLVLQGEPPPPDTCVRERQVSSQRWTPALRERVTAGLHASGRPHASSTAPQVAAALDAWVGRWASVEHDACEDVDGVPDELDVAQALCLRALADTHAATLGVLEHADAEVADHALELVAGLPDPARCADPRVLAQTSAPPEDPALAAELDSLRASVAELVALREAGRIADAHGKGVVLLERARASKHAPLLGEVLANHALVLSKRGEYEQAAALEREAYRLLLGAGASARAAEVADDLVFSLGIKLRRFDEAEIWALQSEALDEQQDSGPRRRFVHLERIAVLRDAMEIGRAHV